MYQSLFSRDMFAELDRLQREMRDAFDLSPSIRGLGRGGFPALNVGSTPQSVEIFAFAPGLDPKSVEVNLDRGVADHRRRAAGRPASGGRRQGRRPHS
jgi:HSP20 family protein